MLYSNWFNVEYVWFFTVSISLVIIFNYSIGFNKLEAVLGCLTAAYFISPLVAYNWKVSGHFGTKKSHTKNWQNSLGFWTMSRIYA